MPRFSIIVPSHGVAGRLSQALDSVLAQSFGDFELIPVCDAPDSPAADVVAGYAERDCRVAPVNSPPTAGLAGARNAGLRAAIGDWLLFLDGDDVLVPGALAALDARLGETGDVDVLYFEHERTPWWVGEPTNPAALLLVTAPDGVFAPERAPQLTGVQLPAWSATYRRAFLAEKQLAFPDGHFTDVGFGGLVVLGAERVAVLRRVVVRHLLRRQGNRLGLPGEHHFELLDQAELVLTRAAERGLSEERLGPLFEQLFAVVLKTAAHPRRLGRGRRAFFRRASGLYRRHRPAGFRTPGGSLGVQHRLLASGAYAAFRALRGANQAAARMASGLPRPRGLRTRLRYRWQLRRPLDQNLAVYCAYWGRGYVCNPAAIHAKARELAPHIRSVFLVEPDAVDSMPKGVEYAVIGSRAYWDVLARAKYLINNANFADAVVKREGSVHLSTQHGTPLKKMGADQATYPVVAAATGSFARLLARVDRWDYNLSSNRHSTQMWERAFPAEHETLEYGYPRNDVYYTATAADVARVRRELGVPEGKKALLYAPTHRDHATGFETGLDLQALCEEIGDEYVVLLRAHYFYDQGTARGSGRIIDVTGHRCAEDVCLAADALITDYSSIMFDYANLDRPIVVYADDWDVYRELRGVYFDLMENAPGRVARTPQELAAVIRDGSYADEEARALRAAFRERFCQFDDGRAAERVVRRVLLGEPPEAAEPVIPLAERIPAPTATTLVRN
ncbi:bifunctional glycosyltransferase family 2 protein/CDP-glycerol:glycerophosphate glycerophosphotransferase [Streptomyces sp. ISL-22]|uniref:bifunctional glycosyltransferase family 2 protein/CDP-glycerol:glycerophosphate glycerophosphotransferase n=1 Tax=unclassified Streptomyces TaxID=2593676 RepID=UPI001BE9F419|nr:MULTISPECIES: bifunctional glycosyltransferase family 2 protein/CDP-glycerol:glycerophosphate glycerophosphotransferase [unclassified Streptomyces]MBT2423577.1 bifunctional glycosyltransferase family 2 protein/CDP-glycerol:glycerophosphate glycerophosphotransferase [Streptomyces sp. ISL-24]MBT2432911.1 bifunctional glycosyltransferase family 2 protein/CDP-glycerol:glycerophosphate glycerophosphotransferase [Streptomyces sp. ISL-22]